MSLEILTLEGMGETQLSATNAARVERDRLLELALAVTTISSTDGAETAARAMRALKGFTRQIEDSRVSVKQPILDLGKKVDGLARELTSDIENESTRLSRMLGAWQAEEKRKEEEAQRKAREEEARIWREAQEKERQRQEAVRIEEEKKAAEERARIADLDAKAAAFKTKEAREKAEKAAESARIKAEMDADQRKQDEELAAAERLEQTQASMVQARIVGNQIVAKKPAGVATRTEIEYEVTNIVALYEAAPYLVKMEPNVSALKAALKGLQQGQNLPGVKHWETAKTHVR